MDDRTDIGAARGWSVGCGLLLAAASVVFMSRATDISDVGPLVRHFGKIQLDRRCSEDGKEAPSGDPCAVSRGYRFVLHTQGRFDVFRVGSPPLRVVSSGVRGVAWHGSSEDRHAILRAFAEAGREP